MSWHQVAVHVVVQDQEVSEGDNVDFNQVSIGPHIDERGIQLLEFRGMTPDATSQLRVGSYHLVHVHVCKDMQTCVTS